MKILNKRQDRPFVVLNLSDIQMFDIAWDKSAEARHILIKTVTQLVEKTVPDLITVSGDVAWSGNNKSYENVSDFLDSFGRPWAPILGNHDHGFMTLVPGMTAAEIVSKRTNCIFEYGDPALGIGNYIVRIEENGKPIHDIFMMDTHKNKCVIMEDGEYDRGCSDDLWPKQMDWYEKAVDDARMAGVKESSIIMHIPLYNYIEAAAAAFKADVDPCSVPAGDGMQTGCWNEGYESSFGVLHEPISACDYDDKQFERILKKAHTKTILVGHDHFNNFVIPYRGVVLAYALKTGCGWSWDPKSNGGTTLTIDSNGSVKIKHHYIDPYT